MATVRHSSGEIAAACAAGVHRAEEAINMAYYRGKVLTTYTTPGHKTKVVIAVVNSPNGVTLSGDEDAVEELKLGEKHIIHITWAPLGEKYETLIRAASQTLSGHIAQDTRKEHALWGADPSTSQTRETLTPAYWRNNLESAVLFSLAVQRLAKQPKLDLNVLIEIGSHPALAGLLRQIRAEL
ncbi:MAG: hypothetical protein Q9184_005694 [Pyrenodesmia sp. 2 TL-2023]